ncbi:reverse transcriptase domain-containing protein [Tanacetum coccineum]
MPLVQVCQRKMQIHMFFEVLHPAWAVKPDNEKKKNIDLTCYRIFIQYFECLEQDIKKDIYSSLASDNYGKYGLNSIHYPTESAKVPAFYSTLSNSNDSVGQGTVSDHSVNDDPIPIPSIEQDHPLKHLEHRGIFDSGCSGNMTICEKSYMYFLLKRSVLLVSLSQDADAYQTKEVSKFFCYALLDQRIAEEEEVDEHRKKKKSSKLSKSMLESGNFKEKIFAIENGGSCDQRKMFFCGRKSQSYKRKQALTNHSYRTFNDELLKESRVLEVNQLRMLSFDEKASSQRLKKANREKGDEAKDVEFNNRNQNEHTDCQRGNPWFDPSLVLLLSCFQCKIPSFGVLVSIPRVILLSPCSQPQAFDDVFDADMVLDVAIPIIKLCSFSKQIYARILSEDDMVKVESQLNDILCNLEQIYPPAFFDIMIHLVIHLPEEALEGGPIPYRYSVRSPRNEESDMIRQHYIDKDPSITDKLFALAYGPSSTPISVNSCIVNGVRFVIHSRYEHRTTQNNGICLPGEKDEEMYYGQLEEILELRYMSFIVVLFRVKWFDTSNKGRKVKRFVIRNNKTQILASSKPFKDQQYILATQVKQVFYLEDMAKRPLHWKVVQDVNHKKFLKGGVIVAPPDIIDVDDDDDFIDDEDDVPHDLADFDDEVLANDDDMIMM